MSHLRVSEYHAHIYFHEGTRASALQLRAAIEEKFGKALILHSVAEGPRGPHVWPMFGVDIPVGLLTEVLELLFFRRGPHSVLVHPVTGDDLRDHTQHALWLGTPLPLNLGVLNGSQAQSL